MIVDLRDVPIRTRYEAGIEAIKHGADPMLTLAAVLFPSATAEFDCTPTFGHTDYCVNGHELNEKNSYYRPNGKRDCRACRSEYRRSHRPRDRSKLKVPCHYCGALCCPPSAKNSAGHHLPRCRPCFRKTLRRNR